MKLEAFVPTQPGWVHVATYEDQVSGAKASRPELDRADRFARSLKVLVGLLEELEAAGVAFRFVHEVRVERKDLILPTFRVLPGLPVSDSGEDPVRTVTGGGP